MTKKATAAAQGDGQPDGEVTYRLWIEYRPACYVGGSHVDTLPDPDDARLWVAYRALLHLEALFRLMKLAGATQLHAMGSEDLCNLFENIGELGASLAVSAYSNVDDASSGRA